jgi:hypothetical protein
MGFAAAAKKQEQMMQYMSFHKLLLIVTEVPSKSLCPTVAAIGNVSTNRVKLSELNLIKWHFLH